MRIPVLLVALFLLLATNGRAGQLYFAVIQFNDKREQADIEADLQNVDLAKITDSDRTETNVKWLRGGWVVFAQSLSISSGNFANSTRLADLRADVTGTLSGSNVSVQISILEGVKVGLRKYRQTNYSGAGSVAGGVPRLISYRSQSAKSANSNGRILRYEYTSVIAAFYKP